MNYVGYRNVYKSNNLILDTFDGHIHVHRSPGVLFRWQPFLMFVSNYLLTQTKRNNDVFKWLTTLFSFSV